MRWLALFVVAWLLPQVARAQQTCPFGVPYCTVRRDGTIVIEPPAPSASGSASQSGSGSGTGTPPPLPPAPPVDPWATLRPEWSAEAAARAAWDLHVRTEAQINLQVRARVAAEMNAYYTSQWQRTPDPYANVPAPRGGGGGASGSLHVPGVTVGPLPPCIGVWTGSGSPLHVGFCPALRVRLPQSFSIDLGPSFLWSVHGSPGYWTLGWHPGVLYDFVGPPPSAPGSRGFVRAGVDAWLPLSGGTRTPGGFLGADVGIGGEYRGDPLGIGLELRGLLRHGVDGDSPVAESMSGWRGGLELRVNLLLISN